MSGTKDLLARFEVGQGSSNLLARFEVGQGNQELPAFFIVRHSTTKSLHSDFAVRHPATKDLYCDFVVRHSATKNLYAHFKAAILFSGKPRDLRATFFRGADSSKDLYAKFTTQATKNLKATLIIRHSATKNLFNKFKVKIFFVEGWEDVKAEFVVTRIGSADLLAEGIIRQSGFVDFKGTLIVRHSDSIDLFATTVIRHSASTDLKGIFIVRHSATADLKGLIIIRHMGIPLDLFAQFYAMPNVDLKATLIVRHSSTKDLHCDFYIRHPYWLWTTRRYLNGVVSASEDLIGDATFEDVVQGVMEDIQGYLDVNQESYDSWTDINLVPVLIRRATTYGTVAALYARHSRTFKSRVITSAAPVTITTIGDEERAMNFWEEKMQTALSNYLTSRGSSRLWVSTADEEPIFSMADIPTSQYGATASDEDKEWHDWLNQRVS